MYKKRFLRIISAVLALSMLTALLPTAAFADGISTTPGTSSAAGNAATPASKFTFSYDDTNMTASVTGFDKNETEVIVPATVEKDGKPYNVTSIGDSAFANHGNLTSVTLPEGVTSIENYAFYECVGLTSITLPESITSIGDEAFCMCASLTSITLPKGVTSIGKSAFMNCEELTSVTIPASVTSIGAETFVNCEKLKDVTFQEPSQLKKIPDHMFNQCKALTSLTLPAGITSIGGWAFRYTRLTSLTLPEGVTSIGEKAFMYCDALTNITIPASVTSVASDIFEFCSQTIQITFGGTEEQWNALQINKPAGSTVTYKGGLHIDPNGYPYGTNGGTMEFTGDGWNFEIWQDAFKCLNLNQGEFDFSGQPVVMNKQNGRDSICINTGATVTGGDFGFTRLYGGVIENGYFRGNADGNSLYIRSSSTIKNGVFDGYVSVYDYNVNTTIENGVFKSGGILDVDTGTLNITGGLFDREVKPTGGTLNITGGIFTVEPEPDAIGTGSEKHTVTLGMRDVTVNEYVTGKDTLWTVGEQKLTLTTSDRYEWKVVSGNATLSTTDWTDTVTVTIDGTSDVVLGVESYTVKFEANGHGTAPAEQVFDRYGTATKPADLTAEGYTFGGWYIEKECEHEFNFDTPITENMTLYAKWTVNKYTVRFETEHGTAPASETVEYGKTLATEPELTAEGYIFGGWYNGDEKFAFGENGTKITGETTLTAKWTEKAELTADKLEFKDHKLSKTDEGVGEVTTRFYKVENGQLTGNPLDTLENAKYGLYQAEAVVTEGSLYKAGTLTSDKWQVYIAAPLEPGKPILYQIMVTGGKADKTEAKKGETITLTADAPAEGEEFAYWMVGGEKIEGNTFEMPAQDVTAKAVYLPKTYSVTFKTDLGTAPAPQTVEHGQTLSTEPELKADGHTFGGWYNGEEKFLFGENGTKITGNITLTAKWDVNEYTVTFDANGHGTAPKPQTVAYQAKAAKPADLTAEGYTFGGWYMDKECKNAFAFDTGVTADLTLYAKWTEVKKPDPEPEKPVTYAISVDNGKAYLEDGETEINTAEAGQTVVVRVNPEAITEGFEFDKWEIVSGEITLEDETASEIRFTMPAGEVELKATVKVKETPAASLTPLEQAMATTAEVAVVGAGAAAVGVAVYGIGTELTARLLLPAGAAMPATNGELALLLWKHAGSPALPVEAPLSETETALRWAVAQGILNEDDTAEQKVSATDVIRAVRKTAK